ncbi:ORF263 [White spot syndrome virus]|uniref:ORF263 n=1 Tax=White spot syndrome virus TaxID=342409 RepID=A0A2D3I6V7_9VIRU|nr:ORF263 [White spot syndrome virus]
MVGEEIWPVRGSRPIWCSCSIYSKVYARTEAPDSRRCIMYNNFVRVSIHISTYNREQFIRLSNF